MRYSRKNKKLFTNKKRKIQNVRLGSKEDEKLGISVTHLEAFRVGQMSDRTQQTRSVGTCGHTQAHADAAGLGTANWGGPPMVQQAASSMSPHGSETPVPDLLTFRTRPQLSFFGETLPFLECWLKNLKTSLSQPNK